MYTYNFKFAKSYCMLRDLEENQVPVAYIKSETDCGVKFKTKYRGKNLDSFEIEVKGNPEVIIIGMTFGDFTLVEDGKKEIHKYRTPICCGMDYIDGDKPVCFEHRTSHMLSWPFVLEWMFSLSNGEIIKIRKLRNSIDSRDFNLSEDSSWKAYTLGDEL